ncbi:MAG: glycosyltransferase family 39 protein [Patescibacteria group bacterium]|nr:glycosyltransferase family 39 protein [Patescibacteria group bacterium]
MQHIKPRAFTFILIAILLGAAFLRIWQLDHADVVTDEAFLGVRSIGYLDFLGTPAQGTPAEWYAVRPWWSYLSFHDHPPLVFSVQHFSMRIFGENVWGLRLPSAFAGIAVVWLLYLIGRQLKNERAGIIAAALGAVELYLIWPSRLGLQESITLALLLSALYAFLRALKEPRWWYAMWLIYGLAVLSKYTVVVFLPIIISYLGIAARTTLREKKFWRGQIVFGVVILPIVIYNLALFHNRGHFDLQISSLLGIDVPAWRFLPGKEMIGSFTQRVQNFLPTLYRSAAPLSALAGLSVLYLVWHWRKPANQFIGLGIGWTVALLMVIGPSPRFLVLLVPWMILTVALTADAVMHRTPKSWRPILVFVGLACVTGLGWFSWTNTFTTDYRPGNPWIVSLLRNEGGNFGYNQLDAVLARELDGFRPSAPPKLQFPVLQSFADAGVARAAKKPEKSLLIAYDADLVWPTPLWYFIRRTIYHGWTAISTDGLKTVLEENQFDAILPNATNTQVMLVVGQNTLERAAKRTDSAEWFVDQLGLSTSTPTAVIGNPNDPRFTLWTVPAEKIEKLGTLPD